MHKDEKGRWGVTVTEWLLAEFEKDEDEPFVRVGDDMSFGRPALIGLLRRYLELRQIVFGEEEREAMPEHVVWSISA